MEVEGYPAHLPQCRSAWQIAAISVISNSISILVFTITPVSDRITHG